SVKAAAPSVPASSPRSSSRHSDALTLVTRSPASRAHDDKRQSPRRCRPAGAFLCAGGIARLSGDRVWLSHVLTGAGACTELSIAAYVRIPDVRNLVTMLRALRIGLFIGTLIGMSACAITAPVNPDV